jgi:hypothetical protein
MNVLNQADEDDDFLIYSTIIHSNVAIQAIFNDNNCNEIDEEKMDHRRKPRRFRMKFNSLK